MAEQAPADTLGLDRKSMAQAGAWDLLGALLGGTETMRTAEWLPRHPRESTPAYNYRRDNSYLYPGFKGAIDALTALPFQKPLTLVGEENLDPRLARLFDDADREGTSLHDFAHACDEEATTYGLVHVLVDYPSPPSDVTRADDAALDIRPYFCLISPVDLLRWKFERDATGKFFLSMVAIAESRTEAKDAGSREEVAVEYVREITTEGFTLHRKDPRTNEWAVAEDGTHSFGMIPIVPVYYDQTGRMSACPPLLDLAWTNLRHFRTESEQNAALSFARFPILFGRGFSEEEARTFSQVGPGGAIFSRNADAQLTNVEHGGTALAAGRTHGLDVVEQMVALGAQPLIEQTSATATGEARQDRRATSKRQEWVNALAAGLKRAYKIAADVLEVELPEDFAVNINGDFVLSAQAALHLTALQSARTARDISQPTLIAELKKRGVLGANVDAEQEAELVAQEGPDLSRIGFGDPAPEDDAEVEADDADPIDKPKGEDGKPAAA